MSIFVNPELRTEPEDNPEQEKINRLYYMNQAYDDIARFLDDDERKEYFGEEIKLFIADLGDKVRREMQNG